MADMTGTGKVSLIPGGLDPLASGPKPGGLTILSEETAVTRGALRQPHAVTRSRHPGDIVLRGLSVASAATVLVFIVVLVGYLVQESWPALTHYGFSFLNAPFDGITHPYVAVADLIGTIYTALVAVIIAGPVGILIAVFLSEIAPGPIKRPLGFLIEFLAAIPSIVYGLWGIIVLVPLFIRYVNPFLVQHFGGFLLFTGSSYSGQEYAAAGLVLAVMILPTIAAISRDVIATVPASQREAMLALGATRWETIWKVVVPSARAGITGAVILGLGRAVGETMAVVLVLGGTQTAGWSLLQSGTTIASTIANLVVDANDPMAFAGLYELALILLALSIGLNVVARLFVWRVNRRFAQ